MTQVDAAQQLRQYLQTALVQRTNGKVQAYNNVVVQFTQLRKGVEADNNPVTQEQLVNLVIAITGCVSFITRKHDTLLNEVFSIKIWRSSDVVIARVLELVINLVVANATFASACFNHLVYNLTPPPAPPAPDQNTGPWSPPESQATVQDAIIQALERIISLVPTAPATLAPMLLAAMPHKLRDRSAHCMYLRALLRLCEGPSAPVVSHTLLRGVVEHLLSIDVEIRWEDIVDPDAADDVAEEEQEEPLESIFELEELHLTSSTHHNTAEDRGGWEGAAAAAPAAAAAAAAAASADVDETVHKMDSMMEMVLQHLERCCSRGQLQHVWGTIMDGFDATLLRTPRSKFTQFLIFFLCMKSPSHCCPALVAHLQHSLNDPAQPPITRSAAAAYLSSFLARCTFIPDSLVISTLQDLATTCHTYAKSLTVPPPASIQNFPPSMHSSSCFPLASSTSPASLTPPQTAKHQVFYAMVQALLYALCYKLRHLITGVPGTPAHLRPTTAAAAQELVKLQVLPLLHHPLRPLDACNPTVASEFATQISKLRLGNCTSLLTPPDHPRPHRPLEMFFPFDPYLLSRSRTHLCLDATFNTWRSGRALPRSLFTADGEHSEDTGTTASGAPDGGDGSSDDDDDDRAESAMNSAQSTDGESSSSDDDGSDEDMSFRSGSLDPGSSGSRPTKLARGGLLRPKPIGSSNWSAATAVVGFSPHLGGVDMGVAFGSSPYGMSPPYLEHLGGTSPVPMSMTPDVGGVYMEAMGKKMKAGRGRR